MAILVKMSENLNIGEDFQNISILIKIIENLDFGQISEKSEFMSNFRKIRILVKIFKK